MSAPDPAELAERRAARLREPARHGAGAPRRIWASLVALACLLAIAGATVLRGTLAEAVRSPLSEKIARADRVSYYLFEADAGPSFALGPGQHSLKLITHLMLPEGAVYDPDSEYAYGVRLRLRDDEGALVWEQELDIRTRQSKHGGVEYGWAQENAFIADRERELSDDRLTRVRLPRIAGEHRLEIRLRADEPAEDVVGLVRVYQRAPRPVDDRTLRELALAPAAGRELVDHVTYRDWEALSPEERRNRLRWIWERLAAEGIEGRDYRSMSIYETGFRVPRGTKTEVERFRVEATRSLAFNVTGPAELGLHIEGGTGHPSTLKGQLWAVDGSVEELRRSAARDRVVSVPAGVHTLVLHSEHPLFVGLHVIEREAPTLDAEGEETKGEAEAELRERVWMSEAERPTRYDDEGRELIEPDLRRIPVVRLGEHHHVDPRWSVVAAKTAAPRTFRFDVRSVERIAGWWPPQAPEPSLEYCFKDREGAELGCERWTGRRAQLSRFEGVQVNEDAGGRDRWYAVSEPQSLRVIAPPEARTVILRQDQQNLLVRGYGYWPEVETEIAEPWRSHGHPATIWRYSPLTTRTWFPIRPANFDMLEDDSANSNLIAQVRLEPRGGGAGLLAGWAHDDRDWSARWAELLAGEDGWDPGPWVTLEPRGRHRRRLILERLDDDANRRLRRRWSSSLFTSLRLGRSVVVDLGAAGPGEPALHWQLPPELLGRRLVATIDGQRHSHQIASTRGRWRLPVEEGRRRLQVELEPPGKTGSFELWIDRPVINYAEPPVSRRRTVHELTRALVFPLVKEGTEALTVNVVVYLPRRREQAELHLAVDGGQPERRVGAAVEHISVVDRRYHIDDEFVFRDGQEHPVDERRAVRFVDLEAQRGLPLETVRVTITLGEDIPAGRHELRVELVEGTRVWVRAFHRGVPDRSKPATSWTEAARARELEDRRGEQP